jgi:Kef-type K+ transport system membrane component KefB
MNVLFSLAFCIIISFAFVMIFKRFRISSIVGMLIAGLLIGSSLSRRLFLEPNTEIIISLGDIGLLSIMFLAGMEISWSMLYKEKRDAALVAIFAACVPFLLGFLTFVVLGFGLEVSLFVGICMSITAEATKAKVLVEMKKLKTKIGSLLMGVGIMDDAFGLGLFILLGYLFSVGFAVKEAMVLSGAVLAFFGGVFIHKQIGRTQRKIRDLEKILFFVISPFFYVSMGINFNTMSLIFEPVLLLIIIAIAFLGKMVGTMLTKPFTRLRMKQLYLVGLGMNSRGAVELALAFIAFRAGFLPVSVYSGLILMALITTMLFPLFFNRFVSKNPSIMN